MVAGRVDLVTTGSVIPTSELFVSHTPLEVSFTELSDNSRADGVAVDVDCGSNPVEEEVDREDENEQVGGKSDGDEHHNHRHDSCKSLFPPIIVSRRLHRHFSHQNYLLAEFQQRRCLPRWLLS